jgi:RNA polymerase sigma factor (sigma-70 family)
MDECQHSAALEKLEDAVWCPLPQDLMAEEVRLRACRQVPNEEGLHDWSDESLALAMKRGFFAREMFEELMARRHEARVKCQLFRRTRDPQKAADLTQEVHAKLWETRLEGYDPEKGPFRRWLSVLVRNLAISAHRHEQRAHSWLLGDGAAYRDPHPGPEEEAIAHETEERAKAILPTLPRDQRRILEEVMRGQTPDDIASTLEVPKERVYQLLYRARRAVEQILMEQHHPA